MKPLQTLLAAVLVGASFAAPAAVAAPTPQPASSAIESALKQTLDTSLEAFNRGDFEGYLHDFFPRVSYNGLQVERKRLVEINRDLKKAFPDLQMRYQRMRITPMGDRQAAATTVAEFVGKTPNYEGSGLPATYREAGQVTALYRQVDGRWATHQLQVAWNDSYIDIGHPFSLMGFSALPSLVGAGQPYRVRLFAGNDSRPNVGVQYAYTVAPLSDVLEKEGAERIFGALNFQPLPEGGLKGELVAPADSGTYAHVLVVNKVWDRGNEPIILGQKVYTRLVRVE